MLPRHILQPIGYAFLLMVALLIVLGVSLGAWRGTRAPVAAALLVSIGTVTAACVAALVWEYKARLDTEAKKTDEERQKNDRLRDVVLAVQADLESDIPQLEKTIEWGEKEPQRFDHRIAVGDKHPLPRGVQSTKGLILTAIENDITILPTPLIKPIVDYYERDLDMGAILDAFTCGRFDKLAGERQREQLIAYIELGPKALASAQTALDAIREWLKEHPSSTVSTAE
jgi:hypothetical protein